MKYALRFLDVFKYKNPLVYIGYKSHTFLAKRLLLLKIELVS